MVFITTGKRDDLKSLEIILLLLSMLDNKTIIKYSKTHILFLPKKIGPFHELQQDTAMPYPASEANTIFMPA